MSARMLHEKYKGRFIDDLCQLVRIPSRSCPEGGEEGAAQRLVAEKMRELGARVRTFEAKDVPAFFDHPLCFEPERQYDDRPTVIGELGPEDAPALLLLAHCDTVEIFKPREWSFDPFCGQVIDGAVCGRGSGDDKWGTATMLLILRALRDAGRPLKRRLILASTVDEENGIGNGALLLTLASVEAEEALYLDGGEMTVYIGNMGGSNLLLFPGADVDAAAWERDAAALTRMGERMSAEREPLFDRPFYEENPTRKSSVRFMERELGGRRVLSIPFYTLPDEDPDAFLRTLEQAVSDALGEDLSLYERRMREPWFEPSLIDADSPMVWSMKAAGREVAGRELTVTTISKQDCFVLNNYAGIPTVSFGVSSYHGRGAVHQPDECVGVDTAWEGARIAFNATLRRLEGEGDGE